MHSLLAATIRQIDIVRNRADFDQICQALQDNHSERLWRLIGPAMRPSLAVAARDSLKQIVREAHRLALNLHSAPYEIRFHFPEPHEDFNRETMMVTDAAESRTFVNQKVRLGLTPITWMGDYSQQRRRMRMVTMSKVIIGYGMPPLNEQITRDRRQSEGQEFKE
ncbi:hypothetical protein VTN31DRAFT_1032 [Thermomyces dupontii]|uniref:uncharacterized protein n=1 Tax=Talaromyces thermophilus TaxID=28565 RepID=UPI003744035D